MQIDGENIDSKNMKIKYKDTVTYIYSQIEPLNVVGGFKKYMPAFAHGLYCQFVMVNVRSADISGQMGT